MNRARTLFDGLRARARRGIALEAVTWLTVIALVFVAVSYTADRTLRLEVAFRAALLVALLAGIVWIVRTRWVRPSRIELTDDELALAVERQDPGIRQSLISAVQFQRDLERAPARGDSPELMGRVVQEVETRLSDLPFHRAVDGARIRKFAAGALAIVVGLGSLAVVFPDEARLWAARNLALSDVAWPRATHLEFVGVAAGLPLRIGERDDLTLRVRASGVVPDLVMLRSELASGEGADRRMEQFGDDEFTITLESMLEDVVVRATGGDGATEALSIVLVPRPKLTLQSIEIEFPAYLAREPRTVEDLATDIIVPRGATLTARAQSDKPLANASAVFGEAQQRSAAELGADRLSFTARVTPTESGALTLDALDDDRLGPTQPPLVFVRLVDDAPPRVEFRSRGIGSLITAQARIPGNLSLRDDNGLTTVTAWMQWSDAVEASEAVSAERPPFESAPVKGLESFAPGRDEFDAMTVLDLLDIDAGVDPIPANQRVREGQLLALEFRASDNFAPTPHEAASETMYFRVVAAEKLLEELQRRQAEQRAELENLLRQERELRAEVAEIVSPKGDDPRAAQAEVAVLGMARRQQALGRQAQGIGERYRQILDEFENNRLFDQSVRRAQDARIASPLLTLAAEDFPRSSTATARFAETGDEASRRSAVGDYDAIIATIERVLAQMAQSEDIAAVVEALRIVIKTETRAVELVEQHREASVDELFGDRENRKENK